MSSDNLRVIVIGLDGATFDLISPWVQQGLLPTFEKLMEEGIWGDLESTSPPHTGAAWSSFITGKNPGKHGIFDFMMRNPRGYDWIPINSTHRSGQSFWNLLGSQGKRAVIFNVPITYPPEPLEGVMVTGFLTPPGVKDFIYPTKLQTEIENEIGPFTPHYPKETYALGREDKFIREMELMAEKNFLVMDYLMNKEPWDLFIGVIQSPDLLQHCLWKFEDKGHPFYQENKRVRGAFLKHYQLIDRYLEGVLEKLDDQTLLLVISDHGFGHIEKQFIINNWLLQEGFLVLKKELFTHAKKILFNMGLVPMRIHKLLTSLGLDLSKPLAKNNERLIAGLNKWILSFEDVDWNLTKAYAMGNMGFINVNLKGREPYGIVDQGTSYERVLDEISERLFSLKESHTGIRLVDRILKSKEMYWGPRASEGPDLYLIVKGYAYCVRGDYLFFTNRVFEDLWLISGSHRPNGILLGKGPGLKKNYRIHGANIMDIGPTILGLMEGLIAEDMDGKCLMEILTEEKRKGLSIRYVSSDANPPQEISLSKEEEELLRKQLKNLGYLA